MVRVRAGAEATTSPRLAFMLARFYGKANCASKETPRASPDRQGCAGRRPTAARSARCTRQMGCETVGPTYARGSHPPAGRARAEGEGEMTSLPKLIPDVDYLLSLETEELAAYLLVALAEQRQNNLVALPNFISGLLSVHPHAASYSDPRRDEIGQAITEAWNWLEVQGLLIPAPGINGSNGF